MLVANKGIILRQNQPAIGSTNWTKIYDCNIAYGSEPATYIPALDPGAFFTGMLIRSVLSSGVADGSGFQVAFNKAAGFTGPGYFVGGVSGDDLPVPASVWNIWIKLVTGTDLIDFIGYG